MLKARFLGTLGGKKVYRFPVEVKGNKPFGTVDDWLNPTRTVVLVTSYSAADAANYVRDTVATEPATEVTVFGPRGGRAAYRFVGYESAVAHAMWNRPKETQLTLADAKLEA